ncbi:hypothetical protein [Alsobacter metallidurans]|nr:hypothetical protein [Alsobacter metallidurans]
MAHAHPHPRPAHAPFSLLRLSVGQRLMGAGVVVALIWALVFWAIG